MKDRTGTSGSSEGSSERKSILKQQEILAVIGTIEYDPTDDFKSERNLK